MTGRPATSPMPETRPILVPARLAAHNASASPMRNTWVTTVRSIAARDRASPERFGDSPRTKPPTRNGRHAPPPTNVPTTGIHVADDTIAWPPNESEPRPTPPTTPTP